MRNSQPTQCYHCGKLLQKPSSLYVQADGQQWMVCCVGCQCVAEALLLAGCAPSQSLPKHKAEAISAEQATCICPSK